MTRSPLVEFDHVSFSYAARTRRETARCAVADVSFDVRPGEILGVIGPNSAGKTTLVRLLTRLLAPEAGEIRFGGQPLRRLAPSELARAVAVVPQELPQGFPFTVGELVLMGRYPHGPGRFFETAEDGAIARDAMDVTGVLDLVNVPLERLSGGERQRAVIARALAQRPRLLVLDEPTTHLDLRYQASAARLLTRLCRAEGLTVVLISHDLNLAGDLCDRLLLMTAGRAAALGRPEEVLDPAVLEAAFACPVLVDTSPSTGRPLVQVAWSEHHVRGRR